MAKTILNNPDTLRDLTLKMRKDHKKTSYIDLLKDSLNFRNVNLGSHQDRDLHWAKPQALK